MSLAMRPLITEKSLGLVSKGKFTFLVASSVSKDMIKRQMETQFNVHVTDVATIIMKGNRKRVGVKRIEEKVTAEKKAIVTLKAGEKIDIFELGS